ncbi:hypothetical protein [Shewanella waksmanii]|uniref:hypothetical protein n=1 Tax=Shewanella waksmanii TaxID=213783 RepID=UPI0037353F32
MQQDFPMTIVADGHFSDSLKPLLVELEMWLNFQALKTDWFANEASILSFEFTLVRTLQEKQSQLQNENWVTEPGYAYHYQSDTQLTLAYIAINDIAAAGSGIEKAIKARLLAVANIVGKQHGLIPLS